MATKIKTLTISFHFVPFNGSRSQIKTSTKFASYIYCMQEYNTLYCTVNLIYIYIVSTHPSYFVYDCLWQFLLIRTICLDSDSLQIARIRIYINNIICLDPNSYSFDRIQVHLFFAWIQIIFLYQDLFLESLDQGHGVCLQKC